MKQVKNHRYHATAVSNARMESTPEQGKTDVKHALRARWQKQEAPYAQSVKLEGSLKLDKVSAKLVLPERKQKRAGDHVTGVPRVNTLQPLQEFAANVKLGDIRSSMNKSIQMRADDVHGANTTQTQEAERLELAKTALLEV